MAATSNNNTHPFWHKIKFQDSQYRLTKEWVGRQVDAETYKSRDWHSPTLKFISYKNRQLVLLNSWENKSYTLTLQVDESYLLVCCGCGNNSDSICRHAYAGIYTILWHLGEYYFERLRPCAAIDLAFKHTNCFDKKESVAGIDAAPRPELNYVFGMSEAETAPIAAALSFKSSPANSVAAESGEGLCYIIAISYRCKKLPALLPCLGKLNNNRTDIKFFNGFLSGIDGKSGNELTNEQKELNSYSFELWKMVEDLPGHLLQTEVKEDEKQNFETAFSHWMKLLPLLLKQPYIYAYFLFGVRELKKRPKKTRIQKIKLSALVPVLKFVLLDKGAYYQLHMQVWIQGKEIKSCSTAITFFIQVKENFYVFSSLRDAAIAECIRESGGCITVFKEHFAAFEQEILQPLQQKYPVEIVLSKRRNKAAL